MNQEINFPIESLRVVLGIRPKTYVLTVLVEKPVKICPVEDVYLNRGPVVLM